MRWPVTLCVVKAYRNGHLERLLESIHDLNGLFPEPQKYPRFDKVSSAVDGLQRQSAFLRTSRPPIELNVWGGSIKLQ